MCNHCLRYGHFARDCQFPPNCKRCTLNHDTKECTATSPQPNMKCINCLSANKRGAQYSTRHRPSAPQMSAAKVDSKELNHSRNYISQKTSSRDCSRRSTICQGSSRKLPELITHYHRKHIIPHPGIMAKSHRIQRGNHF